MRKSLFIASLVLLSIAGCSTQPLPPQLQDPLIFSNNYKKTYFEENKKNLVAPNPETVSPECVNIAKYGRSIAVLKEAGIPSTSLEEYMTNPTVTSIPMRTIQFYVIYKDLTPGQTYADLLLTCHKVGWTKLEPVLKEKTPVIVDKLKLSTELKTTQ